MAGRHYLPPNALRIREIQPLTRAPHSGLPAPTDEPRVLLHRVPPSSAALLEDRIASQHREIQSLLLDNQRLAATHVALKQELSAAQQELRHLSAAAADVKAEKDAQLREVYERSLKMEAEVRSLDALRADLAQVRADVQKLAASKQELTTKLKVVDGDLVRARSELQQLPAVEAEIETMRQHIQRGRAAIEYEKKIHASNVEQSQAMEKNMLSMAQELEKLRAELANAEKRARAAAAAAVAANPNPGYAAGYANPGSIYGGNSYADLYSMHQVQETADAGSQYGYGTSVSHGLYDIQQTHVQR